MAEVSSRQTTRRAGPLHQDDGFDAAIQLSPGAAAPRVTSANRWPGLTGAAPAAADEPAAAGRTTPGPAAADAGCQRFLAFDFGLKRTGVASGNRLTRTASPQASIHATGEARLAQVALRLREWQPDALVVGVPFHPDGAPHENTARAQRFARQLRGRFRLPVFEVDERYSTTEALALGAADADAASACIILEQFLRGLP